MPSFFAGVRIAATYSVVGAIFGEYITAQRGLGMFLKRSYGSFRLDQAYLAIILTAALSLLLVLLVNLIERLALRWYYTTRRSVVARAGDLCELGRFHHLCATCAPERGYSGGSKEPQIS